MTELQQLGLAPEPLLPPQVAKGPKAVKEAWEAGRAFETLLVEQLEPLGGPFGEEGAGGEEGGEPLLAALGSAALGPALAGGAPFGIAAALADRAAAAARAAGRRGDGRGG